MGIEVLSGLLVLSVLMLGAVIWRWQRSLKALQEVQESQEHMVVEERRMFNFLQKLGQSLYEDSSDHHMHQLIVEGATEVVDGVGGAIYLYDEKQKLLVPAYHAKACPPLVHLPERMVEQAKLQEEALMSFLKLHGVQKEEGILGACYCSGEFIQLDDLRQHQAFSSHPNKFQQQVRVMVAPLCYGEHALGVLAVARDRKKLPFGENDAEVFQSLAEQSAFAMGNANMHRAAQEKKQLEKELHTASEIQKVLLPSKSPEVQGYRIKGINIPAKVVSGDYYDYLDLEDGKQGVVIGDVSGKGVPASLIMAMSRSVLRAHAQKEASPKEVLSQVNRFIFPDIREDMFISMAYVILEEEKPEITLCRAGHDAPLWYHHGNRTVEAVKPPGMAVGIDGGEVFGRITQDHQLVMEKGDCLLLYTDGCNEAMDAKGMEYGMKRLEEEFAKNAREGAEAVIDEGVDALKAFMGNQPQHDDITMIAIEKL